MCPPRCAPSTGSRRSCTSHDSRAAGTLGVGAEDRSPRFAPLLIEGEAAEGCNRKSIDRLGGTPVRVQRARNARRSPWCGVASGQAVTG